MLEQLVLGPDVGGGYGVKGALKKVVLHILNLNYLFFYYKFINFIIRREAHIGILI